MKGQRKMLKPKKWGTKLEKFADRIDKDLVIVRQSGGLPDERWVCQFKEGAISAEDGKTLTNGSGRGKSVREAMRSFAENIRGELLIFNWHDETLRQEIMVPSDLVG